WRWMGSAAMDRQGNLALGYSASDAGTNPQLRYAGRLATDPLNTLPQGESHLFDGSGHQTGTGNRWGDYSDLTVDPVDDCTFWYTNEYYSTTGAFNWKTRIASFKFPSCSPPPGFDLTTVPSSANVCAGTSANFTVNAASISGFSGAVTLSGSGNPAPSTLAFSPNPIPSTPGASTLTIDTTGVATGAYPIEIDGTASGAAAQLTNLELDVSAAVPVAPTLLSPADTASIPALRPTFSWSGSDTQSYTIEVASDPAFTNIVFTQTLSGTSVSMTTDLLANTTYFWRVTPTNICGTGSTSAVFTFTTQNAVCSSPGAPIPDNNATGVSDSLVISDPLVVNSLKVYVKARHTWVGDLAFKLTKSAASSILIDRPGVPASTYGCSGDNVDVLLDDAAGTLVENQCNPTPPAIGGTQKPNNPINSVFAGSSFAGTWTLTASDAVAGDTGTLDEWCLVAQLAPPTYTVGGTVSGLAGSGLVLSLNSGAQTLPVSADGSFTFPTGLTNGTSYAVSVGTQPSTQTCTVSNDSGMIAGANVTNVDVTCTTNTYTVGGDVTGLVGGSVSLQLNGGATVTVSVNGQFTFLPLADGSAYAVTVLTQPGTPAQTCSVANGTGTVAGADVTNVLVTCVANTHSIGGTVSGLLGSGLVLQLNGSTNLPISADGTFTFGQFADGTAYVVTVSAQPSGPVQVCTVSNGSGTLAGTDSAITVTCDDTIFKNGFD
ncbi:MAG: proprotein convertase P-domain-containing protein, partial [Dokdonella sp.]